MKKLATAALATSLVLAASALAYDGKKGKSQCYEKSKQCKSFSKKSSCTKAKGNKGNSLINNLWTLDLTPQQSEQLLDIMIKHNKPKQSIADAFTQNSFDKKKYLKIMKQNREYKIQYQANVLSDAYSVLTDNQKKRYLNSLQSNQCNLNKGKKGDKRCNGRR